MRKRTLAATTAGILFAGAGLFLHASDWLIWNRTGSAPKGLYRLSGDPFTPGRWVAVSAESEAAAAPPAGVASRAATVRAFSTLDS